MSAAEPILSGFLYKKSPKGPRGLRAWQKRFFCVYPNFLTYGKSNSKEKTQGAIPLLEIMGINYLKDKSNGRRMQILITNRTFDLQASSVSEAVEWVKVLTELLNKKKTDSAELLGVSGPASTGKFWKNPDNVMSELNDSDDIGLTASVQSRVWTTIDAPLRPTNVHSYHLPDEDTVATHSGTDVLRSIQSISSAASQSEPEDDMMSPLNKSGAGGSWPMLTTLRSQLGRLSLPDTPNYADFVLSDIVQDCECGCVFQATHQESGVRYYMLVVRKTDAHYELGMDAIRALGRLKHAYILPHLRTGNTPDRAWLLYDGAEGGTLKEHLRKHRRVPVETACMLLAEVMLVVQYLWEHSLCFNGMDPERILLDSLGHVRVLDATLASCKFGSLKPSNTMEFLTPEYMNDEACSSASDLWRLGVLLYYLIVGFPPFRGSDPMDIRNKILQRKLRYPPFCTEAARDCIERLLNLEPKQRLGFDDFDELKHHAFFGSIDWNSLSARAVLATEFCVNAVHASRDTSEPEPAENDEQEKCVCLGVTIKSCAITLELSKEELSALVVFAVLKYGDLSQRLPDRSNTLYPKWNDEFLTECDAAAAAKAGLGIEIRLKLTDDSDEFLAGVIAPVDLQEKSDVTLPLRDKHGEVVGEIVLVLAPKSAEAHPFRRMLRKATSHNLGSNSHSRRNTITHMTDKLRGIVSRKKNRFQQDGFDLDLTYVTERLIAMGFPSSNLEGIYRNPMEEVQNFVKTYHDGCYRVYNLCFERSYDKSKFDGNVVRFPIEDHSCPSLRMIQDFCKDVDKFLNEDRHNVAIVHCKAGKGLTGLMLSAYMMYSNFRKTAAEALLYFNERRTLDGKGVTIPSQIRYAMYYERVLNEYLKADREFPWKDTVSGTVVTRTDREFLMFSSPCMIINQNSFHSVHHLLFQVWNRGRIVFNSKMADSDSEPHILRPDKGVVDILINSLVRGDVKIACFYKSPTGKKLVFSCWINQNFIEDNHIILTKADLDTAARSGKYLHPSFTLKLFFKGVTDGRSTSSQLISSGSFINKNSDDENAESCSDSNNNESGSF